MIDQAQAPEPGSQDFSTEVSESRPEAAIRADGHPYRTLRGVTVCRPGVTGRLLDDLQLG